MRWAFACLVVAVTAWAVAAPVPESARWITLQGRVVWPVGQAIPEPKALDLGRAPDAEYTLRGGPVLDDGLDVHPKTRGVKDVVVWIRPDNDKPNRDAPFPADAVHPDLVKHKPVNHTVASEFCRYDKRVVAARAGDTVEFVNAGLVADNVRLSTVENPEFNVLLPPDKSHASKPLKAERMPARFESSIHRWMKGTLHVFGHPYYAVTDEHGRFEIRNVPSGKWRIVYWTEHGYHEGRAGVRGLPLDVKGGPTATLLPVEYVPPEG